MPGNLTHVFSHTYPTYTCCIQICCVYRDLLTISQMGCGLELTEDISTITQPHQCAVGITAYVCEIICNAYVDIVKELTAGELYKIVFLQFHCLQSALCLYRMCLCVWT